MKLRESVAVEGESPAQFIERLKSYLGKWIELAGVEKTYEGLEYLILAEQFTSTCNKNLATFLKERDINSLKELGDGANKFLQAHGKQMKEVSQGSIDRESVSGENESQKPRKVVCWDCGEEGHRQSECKSQGRKKEVPRERSWGEVKCYNCGKMGHMARNCRSEEQRSHKGGAVETVGESEVKKAGVCVKMGVKDTGEARRGRKPRRSGTRISAGFVNGKKVETVRDTGCDTVIVRTGLVRADQFTGETMRCAMMNGRIVKAPVAKINVSTPHLCGEVEALCFKEALYDLVIGNVPKAREPYRPDPEWGKGMVEGEYRSQTERINGDRRASEVVKVRRRGKNSGSVKDESRARAGKKP